MTLMSLFLQLTSCVLYARDWDDYKSFFIRALYPYWIYCVQIYTLYECLEFQLDISCSNLHLIRMFRISIGYIVFNLTPYMNVVNRIYSTVRFLMMTTVFRSNGHSRIII